MAELHAAHRCCYWWMGQTDGQTLYHYMDAGSPLEAGSIVCFCLHVMHYSCMTARCSVCSHTAVHKAQCRLVGWLARVVFHTALIVCVAAECLSVSLSVHLSCQSACCCGGFAAVGPAATRYRSIASRPLLSNRKWAVSRCLLMYEAKHSNSMCNYQQSGSEC